MRFGIVVYDGVEPIDVGATFGVLSMARRVDPAIEMFADAVFVAGGASPCRSSPTTASRAARRQTRSS